MQYNELKKYLSAHDISQRSVVTMLIQKGYYTESERNSLKIRVCMALNGTRTSDSYKNLLSQIESVVLHQ